MTTTSQWPDGARNVLPRELDEGEYSAMMSQTGVDDEGDQYLFYTLPAKQYDARPAPWAEDIGGSTNRKTKVWRCMNSGSGSGSGSSELGSTNGSKNVRRHEHCDDGVTWNGSKHQYATTTDHLKACDGHHGSNTPTSARVHVETRLTSTGQSPSSPLSPASPVSRPSAIPVRVTTNSGKFHYHTNYSFSFAFSFS